MLYGSPPRPGLLACIDCHGEDPTVNNFGRIWTGRNAVALIQRAVANNTGGMGYFQSLYSPADFADIAAWLGNWPTTLTFPLTRPGLRSPPQSVTVSSSTSVGLADLRFAADGEFAISGGSCGGALARFSSCTVEVVFEPSAPGKRSGALFIDHEGTPSPIRIPLAGEGADQPQAEASVTPKAVDFGVAVATLPGAVANVTLSNESGEPLTVSRVDIEGSAFRLVGSSCVAGRPLAAGTGCVMSLRFEPSATGSHAGRLVIAHDGVSGQSAVSLSGQAAAGPAPRLVTDHVAGLDFGAIAIGGVSPVQVVTLQNIGNQAWAAPAATSPDPSFTIERDVCGGRVVAPGATCQIAIAFRPVHHGATSSAISLGDSVLLPAPVLRLAGRSPTGGALSAVPWVMFDDRVGRIASQVIRVVNSGRADLVLSGLAIDGDEAAAFVLDAGGGCRTGLTLPPSSGCDATVHYRPTAAGSHSARLRVVAEEGAATTITLAAHARVNDSGALWIDASTLDFGEQAVGTRSRVQTVALHNRGDAPLELGTLRLAGDAADDFEIGGDCRAGAPIPAGAQCTIELRFFPRETGSRLVSLQLQPTGAAVPALVSLAGRAVSQASARLAFDRPQLRFPPQPSALPGATRRVMLRNMGALSATPAFEVEGPFELLRTDAGCKGELPAASACAIDIAVRPISEGLAVGHLRARMAGAVAASLALEAQGWAQAPLLAWQSSPPASTHSTAAVGQVDAGRWWTVRNVGNADSAPLDWTITGDAARDFSLDPASSCASDTVLKPGASCRLRVAFHPVAAGARRATLALAGEPAALEVALTGRGLAAARGDLVLSPAGLDFAFTPGALPAAQSVVLINRGAAALRVDAISLQGQGFEAVDDATGACSVPPFSLLPGQSCSAGLRWNGSGMAAHGGTLAATHEGAPGAIVTTLSVSEDPSLRSNVGAGSVSIPALLALALVSLLLWTGSRRPPRPKSP